MSSLQRATFLILLGALLHRAGALASTPTPRLGLPGAEIAISEDGTFNALFTPKTVQLRGPDGVLGELSARGFGWDSWREARPLDDGRVLLLACEADEDSRCARTRLVRWEPSTDATLVSEPIHADASWSLDVRGALVGVLGASAGSEGAFEVAFIDLESLDVTQRLPLPQSPDLLRLDPARERLFVALETEHTQRWVEVALSHPHAITTHLEDIMSALDAALLDDGRSLVSSCDARTGSGCYGGRLTLVSPGGEPPRLLTTTRYPLTALDARRRADTIEVVAGTAIGSVYSIYKPREDIIIYDADDASFTRLTGGNLPDHRGVDIVIGDTHVFALGRQLQRWRLSDGVFVDRHPDLASRGQVEIAPDEGQLVTWRYGAADGLDIISLETMTVLATHAERAYTQVRILDAYIVALFEHTYQNPGHGVDLFDAETGALLDTEIFEGVTRMEGFDAQGTHVLVEGCTKLEDYDVCDPTTYVLQAVEILDGALAPSGQRFDHPRQPAASTRLSPDGESFIRTVCEPGDVAGRCSRRGAEWHEVAALGSETLAWSRTSAPKLPRQLSGAEHAQLEEHGLTTSWTLHSMGSRFITTGLFCDSPPCTVPRSHHLTLEDTGALREGRDTPDPWQDVAFSSKGLIAVREDGELVLLAEGSESVVASAPAQPSAIALDPAGLYMAAAFREGDAASRVELWRLDTLQRTASHRVRGSVGELTVSHAEPDGPPVVTVGMGLDGVQLLLTEALEPSNLKGGRIRGASTRSLVLSEGGVRVVDTMSGHVERVLGGWGGSTYRARVKGDISEVDAVALSPDAERVLVASRGDGVHLRDARSNRILDTLPTPERATFGLGFLDAERVWIAGCERWLSREHLLDERCREQRLVVWDVTESRALVEIPLGSRPPVGAALALPGGDAIVTARCKKAKGSDEQDVLSSCYETRKRVLERWSLTDGTRTQRIVVDEAKHASRVAVGDAYVWLTHDGLLSPDAPSLVTEDHGAFIRVEAGSAKPPVELFELKWTCVDAWELDGDRLNIWGCGLFQSVDLSDASLKPTTRFTYEDPEVEEVVGLHELDDAVVVLMERGLVRYTLGGERLETHRGLDDFGGVDPFAISPDGRWGAMVWYEAENPDLDGDAIDVYLEVWDLEAGRRVFSSNYGKADVGALVFTERMLSYQVSWVASETQAKRLSLDDLTVKTTTLATEDGGLCYTRGCAFFGDEMWQSAYIRNLDAVDAYVEEVPVQLREWGPAAFNAAWVVSMDTRERRVWLWPRGSGSPAMLIANADAQSAIVHPNFAVGSDALVTKTTDEVRW